MSTWIILVIVSSQILYSALNKIPRAPYPIGDIKLYEKSALFTRLPNNPKQPERANNSEMQANVEGEKSTIGEPNILWHFT